MILGYQYHILHMTPPLQRQTRQRTIIREVMEKAGRPLGPHEIANAVKTTMPSVGIATVYRTVKAFVAEGYLCPVNIAGQTKFEKSDLRHHHHFHCRTCETTFDIQGCPGGLERLVPDGFHADDHDLIIHGICQLCGKSPKKKRVA